jgi:Septum formation
VRRWFTLVVCTAALVVLTGCTTLPDGVDGDLTNGWNLPPKPTQFRPVTGRCFDELENTSPMSGYAPIDCAELHLTETFYVGDLTGPAAVSSTDLARSAAGSACTRQASGFLGGDWRTGQLQVKPVLPGPKGWVAGARWFRCDAAQIDLASQRVIGRTGTLKGALTGAAKLKLTCFNPTVQSNRVREMKAVACSAVHHAEFVGRWAPANPTTALLNDDAKAAGGCRSAIAGYTGIPDDGNVQFRVGWIGFAPTDDDWSAGARDVQCFLWIADAAMKGSYRGVGAAKLPINYD